MQHHYYLIIASLSLMASALLASLPLIAPDVVLAPFIFANWVFFIVTGFALRRRARVPELTWKQSRSWDRLFAAALISFTGAGWFAVASGNPVV